MYVCLLVYLKDHVQISQNFYYRLYMLPAVMAQCNMLCTSSFVWIILCCHNGTDLNMTLSSCYVVTPGVITEM